MEGKLIFCSDVYYGFSPITKKPLLFHCSHSLRENPFVPLF